MKDLFHAVAVVIACRFAFLATQESTHAVITIFLVNATAFEVSLRKLCDVSSLLNSLLTIWNCTYLIEGSKSTTYHIISSDSLQ